MTLKNFLSFCVTCYSCSCNTLKKSTLAQTSAAPQSLKFLGAYQIPFSTRFNNTTVGGLSGIDYDAATKRYYIISDDRSAINPARYYTASIFLTQEGIDSVVFSGVVNLLQSNGELYPGNKQDPYHTPDPEAIRFNPLTKLLAWSSEGERIINNKDTVLVNPAITTISPDGKYKSDFILPQNLTMQPADKGPRQNGSLEGITFSDDYTTLFVSLEEPLYEDGPRADTTENYTHIRLAQFDMAGRRIIKQYAYKPEPVAHPPRPASAFKINGVTDILSWGKNKLLVVERSFSTGRLACTVKLFIADFTDATDISTFSLTNNTGFIAVAKKLLLNMDTLGIYIDNIEGVTFGPQLANGHQTLIFIADNNFSPLQQSQLLLFEIVP